MTEAAPNFGADDVRIASHKRLRAGFFELHRYELSYKLVVGGWSAIMPRDCLIHGGTVAVLPYDPYADKVVLIERFRVGAMDELCGPWQMELPSGAYDADGLSPKDRAHIEVETLARIGLMDVEAMCSYLSSPSVTNEKVHLFCGGVVFDEAGPDHWAGGPRDEVSCHLMDRQEAYLGMQEGYINNAVTIIALQWLQLNFERLREKWR